MHRMRITHLRKRDPTRGDARAPRGILFVSHDATRTGAPIALLHFLRWFRANASRAFSVVLGSGGELVGEFEELAPTWSLDWSHWRAGTLRTQLLKKARLGAWARRAEIADTQNFAAMHSPALVYVNSIASARAIEILAPTVPVLTHVHELESYFQRFAGQALERLLGQTRRFIACSDATRNNLISEHGVAAERVETVHESIRVDRIRADRTRQQIFEELRMPDNALLIVGIGTPGWRKGTDLFIHLARAVCQKRHLAYFGWIGGSTWDVEHDVRICGLAERMRFIGVSRKPYDYLAAADVFVLTSREDPYPLVCLEAAALEKPIVCFANAGGASEFVEEDCGFVVPYLDMVAMTDRIVSLIDSADRRRTMGTTARRKVIERHDVSRAALRITDIIERTIARG
jgi:glycosyltransferase involved in cell wall biosynthesis